MRLLSIAADPRAGRVRSLSRGGLGRRPCRVAAYSQRDSMATAASNTVGARCELHASESGMFQHERVEHDRADGIQKLDEGDDARSDENGAGAVGWGKTQSRQAVLS